MSNLVTLGLILLIVSYNFFNILFFKHNLTEKFVICIHFVHLYTLNYNVIILILSIQTTKCNINIFVILNEDINLKFPHLNKYTCFIL